MDCDWHSWFSVISNLITIVTTPLNNCKIGAQSKRLSFFNRFAFFGGLPFAFLVLPVRAALSSVSSVNCRESCSLFGPLAPHLAASVVAHWGGNRTVPWPLVLRLLASAELCSTEPASPAWSSREPSDLIGLDPGDPLGLMQDVPWALSRNP